MQINLQSDLHLEFQRGEPYSPNFMGEDVLILAGDVVVGLDGSYEWFVRLLETRNVIYLIGNHELYHNDLLDIYLRLPLWTARVNEEAASRGFKFKLFSLQNQTVKIDNVNFIGGTLFTDFNKNSEFVKRLGPKMLNDFHYIKNGDRKISADDLLSEHKRTKKYISDQLRLLKGEKNVVITHHLPSYEAIAEEYRIKPEDELYARAADKKAMNHFFYSNLESVMKKADYWFFGHTHSSSNFKVGKCQAICNPRGYFPNALNPNFINGLIVEI